MPSWPTASRHQGQGPRPMPGKKYGIGGFRGMNPQPGSSKTIVRDYSIPIVNKNRGILNSNDIIKNSPQFGNRFKKASNNSMNISTPSDTENQHSDEGKSKALSYLEKWQHTTNMPKDSFKTEIEHERLRSSDHIARSRGASSPRKHDIVNINRNKIFNRKDKFSGQNSKNYMSLNSIDVSHMHERPLSPQQVKRKRLSPGQCSGSRISPVPVNSNKHLFHLEHFSTSLREKNLKDSSILHKYPGNRNLRSQSPGKSLIDRYQSVKEFEEHKNNMLHRSYSPDREGLSDRNYSNLRDPSTSNEMLGNRRQSLVEHISRHSLHHRSVTSERQHSHNRSTSDISPEPRSFSRQSSSSGELSQSRRRSPPRDYKSYSLAQRLADSKGYKDDKDLLRHIKNEKDLMQHIALLKKGRSPTRQTTSVFQEIFEKQKPEYSEVRVRPKEYYDSREGTSDRIISRTGRSISPTDHRMKSPMTRRISQERIKVYKDEKDLLHHDNLLRSVSPTGYHVKSFVIRGRSQERIKVYKDEKDLLPHDDLLRSVSPTGYRVKSFVTRGRSQERIKVYKDEKYILHHDDLLRKGRSPTRQTISNLQDIYEKQKPEYSGMRDQPREIYDSRGSKRDRSFSPPVYRVKSPITRGRSQERILKRKSHRSLSPNEQFHKHASSIVRNISPRRSHVLPRADDQYAVELSRLSPYSFLENIDALHKEYSPVLMIEGDKDDGYRSREGSQTSSLERGPLSNKRYRGEILHKKYAKSGHGLKKYGDSHLLEKDSYSHRRPVSERLGAVLDSPDKEEDVINDISLEIEDEEKEDLRCELLRIKGEKVEKKIRMLEENERETDYKLSLIERKLERKEHEESSAKIQQKINISNISGSNRLSGVNDIQPRNHKTFVKRNTYSDNINSGKYPLNISDDTFSHSQKRKPITVSMNPSRSIHKKESSEGTFLHSQKRMPITAVSVKPSSSLLQKESSAGNFPHSQKRKPINAVSVKPSRPLLQKESSAGHSPHSRRREPITDVSLKPSRSKPQRESSADTFPHSRKRGPTTAVSVKSSRSSPQKKESIPLPGLGRHSPIHF